VESTAQAVPPPAQDADRRAALASHPPICGRCYAAALVVVVVVAGVPTDRGSLLLIILAGIGVRVSAGLAAFAGRC